MGGYGSDKKAIYGYVNKNGPILYGRDDNEDFNSNNNNYSSYNNHNQHQLQLMNPFLLSKTTTMLINITKTTISTSKAQKKHLEKWKSNS